MKKSLFLYCILIIGLNINAQEADSLNSPKNTTDNMMHKDQKLTVGGYAQIDYTQDLSHHNIETGELDVHRMVLLFGYKFNDRTQFFTEIEYEHVQEVYVEQAFIDYKINNYIHFRGGLMLIPMGIVNEYHEPPSFNGVERPLVDKYIVPTTWRELGVGFTGNLPSATLKYQLYIVNGFKSYDGSDYFLSGENGLRNGRQKGAKSFISSPNLSAKVDFYGLPGLNLGLAGYFGKTQSQAYDGIQKDDGVAKASADSTVVGISMISADARYQIKGLQLRGQFSYMSLSNTEQYNAFINDPVGSAMIGYYLEIGYNIFQLINKLKSQFIPFVRFEHYNTHHKVGENITADSRYSNQIITAGAGWKITPGVALKSDLKFIKSEYTGIFETTFNAGIGVMF